VIEIVFFDAGETILHPHPSFPELFARVCRHNGVDVRTERVRAVQERLAPHLVDLGDATGVEHPSLSPEGSRIFWSHLYRRLLGELGIADEALVGKLYATFSHTSSYKLFDDALPALAELDRLGYRLGLISNFERWLEEMLIELELGNRFDVSVISGVEGREKPDPGIYEAALAKAGVEPGRAVHVGDSPALDVAPASSLGMATILLDRFDRYPQAEGARVRTLTEVPEVVARLASSGS
jgi:putative hydrolase of the HAD superfamily